MNIIETIFIALIGTLVGFVIGMSGKGKKKSINRVHFYVARDKDGALWLYSGKPFRDDNKFCPNIEKKVMALTWRGFKGFGLNENDYANLKWEDEPVEVFLNMEE